MHPLLPWVVLVITTLVDCYPHHKPVNNAVKTRRSSPGLQISIGHPLHAAIQRNLHHVTDLHAPYLRLRRDVPGSSYNRFDEKEDGELYSTTISPVEMTSSNSISPDAAVPILKQAQDSDINGSFSYSFEAANGISVQVKGIPKSLSDGAVVVTMEGEYAYTAPDGTNIRTRWFADETGFHVEAAHLPV